MEIAKRKQKQQNNKYYDILEQFYIKYVYEYVLYMHEISVCVHNICSFFLSVILWFFEPNIFLDAGQEVCTIRNTPTAHTIQIKRFFFLLHLTFIHVNNQNHLISMTIAI